MGAASLHSALGHIRFNHRKSTSTEIDQLLSASNLPLSHAEQTLIDCKCKEIETLKQNLISSIDSFSLMQYEHFYGIKNNIGTRRESLLHKIHLMCNDKEWNDTKVNEIHRQSSEMIFCVDIAESEFKKRVDEDQLKKECEKAELKTHEFQRRLDEFFLTYASNDETKSKPCKNIIENLIIECDDLVSCLQQKYNAYKCVEFDLLRNRFETPLDDSDNDDHDDRSKVTILVFSRSLFGSR
jgi:hypothetical protein